MNNRGSLTLEMALIMPFVFLILFSFILLTVYYHDFIISRVAVNDGIFRAYFNDSSRDELSQIVVDDRATISESESFLFEYDNVSFNSTEHLNVFGISFDMKSNQSIKKIKKKTFVNLIDMGDNALSMFNDLKKDEKVKEKLEKIKSMIK